MKRYGFVFDLDGVLVDTARLHLEAWSRLSLELGHRLSVAEADSLRGISRMDSLRCLLAYAGIPVDTVDAESLAERKNQWYVESLRQMSAKDLLPGVREFLRASELSGIPCALASSSRNARLAVELTGISECFQAMVDGTDISQAKPDPSIFLLAAQRLGMDPKDCIVFEDAASGVEAACNASMFSVGIGRPALLHSADIVLSGFRGIHPDTILLQLIP